MKGRDGTDCPNKEGVNEEETGSGSGEAGEIDVALDGVEGDTARGGSTVTEVSTGKEARYMRICISVSDVSDCAEMATLYTDFCL